MSIPYRNCFIMLPLMVLSILIFQPHAASAQSIQPIYSFTNGPAHPSGGLILGPNGNFYGTTYGGGRSYGGTVFRVTTNGVLTTLADFNGANGQYPEGALTLGPDGNFYGTTYEGGGSGEGTVFRVTTTGMLTTLVNFANTNGASPNAALALGPDGNFYGTTEGGGSSGEGTVFRVTTNGVLTTIYSFTATTYHSPYTNSDGANPETGLTLGPDGNFYGTTRIGGSSGEGTLFKITTNGVLTMLHSFSAIAYNGSGYYTNSDGANPEAALTLGPSDNFYGTTVGGGSSDYGTVFEVTTNGVLTTLVSFANTNGASPDVALTLGSDGNFYGTTYAGGSSEYGTVFRVATNGVLTTLASFAGTNGAYSFAAMTLGPDGNFYGMTENGGSSDFGTVFQVTTNGVLSTLVSFANTNGANPATAMALGPNGNFYGTTEYGGSGGKGTVFEVTTNGVLTTLVSFANTNGANPYATLTLGPDGNFYGTTEGGGSSGNGTIFQFTTNGVLTTLANFNGANGESPYAGLTLGPDGNFYGTTEEGGTNGYGTVFQVTTDGVLTTLVTFAFTNGEYPYAALALGPDGNFYGTTEGGGSSFGGTVFRVTTNGVLTTLVNFNGAQPEAGMTLGPDGNFYGTTYSDDVNGYGTIFRVTSNGVLTTLVYFTGFDGYAPIASLTLGPDGNFYGTTEGGGSSEFGTVFEVTTNGVLTTLYSFTGRNDGQSPGAALALGPDGNFYGTTGNGGTGGGGVIYCLDISPPEITGEPVSVMLPISDTAYFSVSATGGSPLYYQWYFNTNAPLSSATNAGLAISPAITNDDGYYQVIVSNLFGSATSDVASLNVLVEPNMAGISNNPSGGTTTLSMGSYPGSTNYLYATTNLTLPMSQWQLIAANVAASNGLFQFIDPNTKGVPAKFYRLSSQLIAPTISYTYTGQPFTYATDGLTTTNYISGSVTLTSALAPNLTDTVVSPLGYSFTDGIHTVNQANTLVSFVVSTDANGALTAWDFTAYSYATGAPQFEMSWLLSGQAPTGTAPDQDTVSLANVSIVGQNSDLPGTWSSPAQ